MRDEIALLNRHLGLHVFKPGYPVRRGQYMILDAERKAAFAVLADAGFRARRVPCGHDYNHGGDLYAISRGIAK